MSEVKRILSGIRATGQLHLGNYLGMVKGMLVQQDKGEYDIFFMVADLHATTTPFNPAELKTARREIVLDYLSAGLNPEKSKIFLQADVGIHGEFTTYLATTVTIARMQHLPTFKEKVKQQPDSATMALLNYPILQAADILLYKADLVPAGVDQEPHLEVAREIARKMNQIYSLNFPEPVRFATKGEYVPSLTGEGKMSKSVAGSFINLTDELEEIKQKLAAAPTDSGQGEQVPSEGGVANLLTLVELFQGKDKRSEYEAQYTSTGLRYSDLKAGLAEAICQELEPIQKKRRELEKQPDYVNQIIEEGAQKARAIASETLAEVKEKMGLR